MLKQKQDWISYYSFWVSSQSPGFLYLLLWGQPGYPGVAGLMNHKQEQMASSQHHSEAAYQWPACNLTTNGRAALILRPMPQVYDLYAIKEPE